MAQDDVFLRQVQNLSAMSRNAAEEAQQYADGIQDKEMKAGADKIMEELHRHTCCSCPLT